MREIQLLLPEQIANTLVRLYWEVIIVHKSKCLIFYTEGYMHSLRLRTVNYAQYKELLHLINYTTITYQHTLSALQEHSPSADKDVGWRDFEICDELGFALRCLQVECHFHILVMWIRDFEI